MSDKFRQKWWLAVVLAALLIGYLVWKVTVPDSDMSPSENMLSVAEEQTQTEVAPEASTQSDEMTSDATLSDNVTSNNELPNEGADIPNTSNTQTLDPKTILNAPLPETDSLAKEEIDRLEDERQRLAEQEKLAAEQLAMNKQLTEMKAEQIALLEQQIAQLEASNTDKPAVE